MTFSLPSPLSHCTDRRMGCTTIFRKGKKFSLRIKGKFWSILLFLFYLEGIYVPTVQQQVHLWQLNKNYCDSLCFTQMCLCYGGGIGTKMSLNRVSCHWTINDMPLNQTSFYRKYRSYVIGLDFMPLNRTSFHRIIYFMSLDRTSFYWIIRNSMGLHTSFH